MASSSTSPALVPYGAHEGKPPIPIARPVWIIGSRKGCHLNLVSPQISQAHAVIINTGRGLFIKDLGSRTHTFVNKRKVTETQLKEGDKVQIGNFRFRFTDPTTKADAIAPTAQPALLRISGESSPLFLESRVTLIGRRANADVPLTDEAVSSLHALIIDLDGDHYVRDLGSRTGTFVNGEKVHQSPLNFGDVIKIGPTEFTYDAAEAPPIADEGLSLSPAAPLALSSDEPLGLDLSDDQPLALDQPEPAAATPASEPLELDLTAGPLIEEPTGETSETGEDEPSAPPTRGFGVRRGWRSVSGKPESPDDAEPSVEPSTAQPAEPVLDLTEFATEPTPEPLDVTEPAPSQTEPVLDLTDFSTEPAQPLDVVEPSEPVLDLTGFSTDVVETVAPVDVHSEPVQTAEPLSFSSVLGDQHEPPAEPATLEAEPSSTETAMPEPALPVQSLVADPAPVAETSDTVDAPATSVFENVDVDALALDALNEPADEPLDLPGGPGISESSLDEPLDLRLSDDAPAEPMSINVALPPEPPLPPDAPELAPLAMDEPAPTIDFGGSGAIAPPVESMDDIDLSSLSSTAEQTAEQPPVVEEAPPSGDDDKPRPLFVPAPRGKKKTSALLETELPPALEAPVKLKPTRRRKPPARRGKADEAEAAPEAPAAPSRGRRAAKVPTLPPRSAEVIEPTKPTPESALQFDAPSLDAPIEPPASESAMSDTAFGRDVAALTETSLGDLVEPPEPARARSPFEQIVADASALVEDDKPPGDDQLSLAPETPVEIVPQDEVTASELELSDSGEHVVDLSDSQVSDRPEHLTLETTALAVTPDEPEHVEPPVETLEPRGSAEVEPELSADEAIDELAGLSEAPTEPDEPATSFAGTLEPSEPSATLPEQVQAEEFASEPTPDQTPAEQAVQPLPDEIEPLPQAIEPLPEADEPEPAPVASPAAPVVSQPPAVQPFFGLTRDADTFLGGLPLALPELAPPPPGFGRVGLQFAEAPVRDTHQSPAPPPLTIGDGADEPDEPPVAPTPIELPDEAPQDLVQPPDVSATHDIASSEAPTDSLLVRPRGKTPPRPKRSKLADYESRFANVAEDQALQELLKSQPPVEAPGQSAAPSGFDGLSGASSVRTTDVFSQMPAADAGSAFSAPRGSEPSMPDKETAIDQAARNVPVGHRPPGSRGAEPFDPFGSAPDIPVAQAADDPILAGAKVRRSAAPVPAAVAPDLTPALRRRKQPISLRMLVVAMVLSMIGAGVAGYLLTPVYSVLQAKSTFQNLSQRSEFERSIFRSEQERLLNNKLVRDQAIARLKEKHPAVDPGILADDIAFHRMITTTGKGIWPAEGNDMLLRLESIDPAGDRLRLASLLDVLYSENQGLKDKVENDRKQYAALQHQHEEAVRRRDRLVGEIRDLRDKQSDAPRASDIGQLEQQTEQLRLAWMSAMREVEEQRLKVDRLSPSGAAPVEAGSDPDKDAIVLQWREDLKALNTRLEALKSRVGLSGAEIGRKALDDALAKLSAQLATVKDQPQLATLAGAGEKLQSVTQQLTGDLLDRQKKQHDGLMELKRKADEQTQAKRQELFNSDAELKSLVDQQTAAGKYAQVARQNGLEAEEARWNDELARVSAKVEARRATLNDDPSLKKLQADVDPMIKQVEQAMDDDRKRLDGQMAEAVAAFDRAAAQIDKLPADQKPAARELVARKDALVEARRAYLALANDRTPAGDTGEIARLESEAKSLAGKLEQRVGELSAKRNGVDPKTAAGELEQARAALTAAEKAATATQEEWSARLRELLALRDRARAARQIDEQYQAKLAEQQKLNDEVTQIARQMGLRQADSTAGILPEAPTEASVSELSKQDDRLKYAVICAAVVFGVFVFLILLGGYHHFPAEPAVRRGISDEQVAT